MANSMATVGGTVALLLGVFVGGWMADLVGDNAPVIALAGAEWLVASLVATQDPEPAAPPPRARGAGPGRAPARGARVRRRDHPAGANAAGPRADHVDHARPGGAGHRAGALAVRVPRSVRGGRRVVLEPDRCGRARRAPRHPHGRQARGATPEGADRRARLPRRRPRADRGLDLRHRLERPDRELRRRAHVRVEEDPGRHDGPGGDPRRLPGPGVRRVRRRVQPVARGRGVPRDPAAERVRRGVGGGDRRRRVHPVEPGPASLDRSDPRALAPVLRGCPRRGGPTSGRVGRGRGDRRGRAPLAGGNRRRAHGRATACGCWTARRSRSPRSSPTAPGRSSASSGERATPAGSDAANPRRSRARW